MADPTGSCPHLLVATLSILTDQTQGAELVVTSCLRYIRQAVLAKAQGEHWPLCAALWVITLSEWSGDGGGSGTWGGRNGRQRDRWRGEEAAITWVGSDVDLTYRGGRWRQCI